MFTKIVITLAIVAACKALLVHHGSRRSHHIVHHEVPKDYELYHHEESKHEEHNEKHHEKQIDEHAYPKYIFKYGVEDPHSGDYKSHKEMRDGDIVKGEYSLLQPDGSYRTVTYFADPHTGFHAHVHYTPPILHEH